VGVCGRGGGEMVDKTHTGCNTIWQATKCSAILIA
jgi:hypothetical protein